MRHAGHHLERGVAPEVCGEAAVLVDPRRASDISAALERVLTDEALRGQMIERGRRQAARFDWTESARRLVEVLRAAVGAPAS